MKNFIKLSYLLLALPFVACSDGGDDYEPAAMPTGSQVYFSNENSSSVSLLATDSSFSVEIDRMDASSALDVAINASGDGVEYYNVPTSVSFASGQKTTNIEITFDPDEIGFDNEKEITLSIADESLTTKYGYSSLTFTVNIPAPWTTLGTGTVIENFWTGETYSAKIQQNDINPNIFRVVNPFPSNLGFVQGADYFEFRIYKAGETLLGQTLTQDIVYYSDVAMHYYDSYDAIINNVFPGRFTEFATEDTWAHNTVTAYQENGLPGSVQIAPYYYMFGVGGWNFTQNDNMLTFIFPGYAPKDYSIEATYDGILTKGDLTRVVSYVTLGADVEKALVAVVPESALETVEEDIIAGTVESVEITEEGTVGIDFTYKDPGKYYIVAVAMAEGEEVDAVAVGFNYTSSTESWKQIGTGTYTYAAYWTGDDTGLAIYQSESNPLRYKIKSWCYGVDFCFTMSANKNLIIVDNQETGYVYTGYGMVNVNEASDADSAYAGGTSSYDEATKTFTFQVAYGIPSISYWWAGKAETFVLDDSAAEIVARRSISLNSSLQEPSKQNSLRKGELVIESLAY